VGADRRANGVAAERPEQKRADREHLGMVEINHGPRLSNALPVRAVPMLIRILFAPWAIFMRFGRLVCGCASLWQTTFHH
jgi:hypothetical protein